MGGKAALMRGARALSGVLAWTRATLSRCHGQQTRRKLFPEPVPAEMDIAAMLLCSRVRRKFHPHQARNAVFPGPLADLKRCAGLSRTP